MKEITLLKKGLFDKKFMDSRVKTRALTRKEKILGHLIGPLGLILVVNTIALVVEKFFMQMVGLTYPAGADGTPNPMAQSLGDAYQTVMAVIKLIVIAVGFLNSWLISHTQSRQGRFRPWYMIFGFATIVIGFLMFLFSPNIFWEAYWVYFFILLAVYHTIGTTFFYLFRDNIVSVVTRDPIEKQSISFMRKLCWTLVSGILIGLVVNSVLVPFWLQNDINGYPILMIALSTVAIPLFLLEYFYTKERVVEDVNLETKENANKPPLKAQLKALFTNKNYVILLILTTLGGIVDNFKGGNVQYYYIQYLLGGVENPSMQMIYQIVTGVPLGLGAFLIYPLSKKVGIRNLTIGGYALVLVGSIIGWVAPSNVPMAIVGGFLRNVGWLPNSYVIVMLTYYAFDDVEFRTGLRLEGLLGIGIVVAIQNLLYAPFAGGYESSLLNMGFIDNLEVMPNPSDNIKNFMSLAFYLFDIIISSAYVILLPFVDVEKHIGSISRELISRKREAVIAQGKTWYDPEVQDQMERAELAKQHEEDRIADLKELCAKKGLDFEAENAKYLAAKKEADEKQAEKDKKKAEKAAAKKAKQEARAESKEAKRVAALKAKCAKQGLDFEAENKKYFDALAEKKAKKADEEAAWREKELQKYRAFRSWMGH